MRVLFIAASALVLAACTETATNAPAAPEAVTETGVEETAVAPAEEDVELGRAGTYALDRNHASLTWRVSHFGLSNYTGRFTEFDATLQFNPDDASATSVTATINPMSVETDYPGDYQASHPDTGFESWNEDLARSGNWFRSDEHPTITFTSTSVSPVTASTGTITGDLTFLGTTLPVTLDVRYNGVVNFPWDPETDVIGFSATGTINRIDFGLAALQGPIGDEVEIIIEAEFREVAG